MSTAVAFRDLMDRSRLDGRGVRFVDDPTALPEGTTTLVVDLVRHGVAVVAPLVDRGVRVVGVVPHVDHPLRADAAAAGLQVVARSWFFAHLDEVVGPVLRPQDPDDQPSAR